MVLQACSTKLLSNRSAQFIQILLCHGRKGTTLQLILRRQHNPDVSKQKHYKKGNRKFVSLGEVLNT